MENFGENLKRLRRAAQLTQSQLAQKAGVANGTIGNYEAGHRANVSFETLFKIADALGVEPEELGLRRRCDVEEKMQTADPIDQRQNIVLQLFSMLNDDGKAEALKRLEELTEIKRYYKGR